MRTRLKQITLQNPATADTTIAEVDKVHPNKKSRLKTLKPTIVKDKKINKQEEKKPLTKLELKATKERKESEGTKKEKKKKTFKSSYSARATTQEKEEKENSTATKKRFLGKIIRLWEITKRIGAHQSFFLI